MPTKHFYRFLRSLCIVDSSVGRFSLVGGYLNLCGYPVVNSVVDTVLNALNFAHLHDILKRVRPLSFELRFQTCRT